MRTRHLARLTGLCVVALALAGPSALASADPAAVPPPVAVTPDDAGDRAFGSGVDVDGDTMVVAAVCDPTAGGNCDGSVYAFVRSGDDWVQQQKIVPPDPQRFAEFGQSVAVSGDTIVVGSNRNLPGAGNAGKAYVYVRTGTTWSLQAQLLHRDPQQGDHFGGSVAIDGDTLVVGAYGDDIGGLTEAGSASVFTRSGTVWTEQELLGGGSAEGRFGWSVAVQADIALVGARADDTVADTAGAVYVFHRSRDDWRQRAVLTDPDGFVGEELGYSVALDGGTAVAGGDESRAGRALVFVRSGRTWGLQATLVPRNGGDSTFGRAVDISGDTVVVGDRYDSQEVTSGGAAYVYTRTGESWTRGIRLKPESQNTYDQFGVDVAADDGLVAVGAFTDPDEAVYVYER